VNGGKVVWVEVRTVVANPRSSNILAMFYSGNNSEVPLQDTTSGDEHF
jgi:hypothetical protein